MRFPEFPGAGGPVADVHVHVQPWKMMKPEALAVIQRGRADVEEIGRYLEDPAAFVAFLDRERIARVGIVNYPAPDTLGFTEEVNDFSTAFAKAAPGRVIPFGGVLPTGRARAVAQALDEAIDLGVKAVKLHPPHQRVAPNAYLYDRDHPLRAVYEGCQAAGLPVIIHTGTSIFPGARSRLGDPLPIDDVAVDFPELRIVVAHAGRPLWTPTASFLARRHANVFLDLSGMPPKKLLEYLPDLERLAPKCLWGTDWPGPGVKSMAENVRQFLDLPLPAAARRAILWDNHVKLFPP